MSNSILDQLTLSANKIYGKSVLRDLCIAQGILESNLYATPSLLASLYNNLFGIKKSGTKGVVILTTWEEVNNKKEVVKGTFGNNNTITDSVLQYQKILDLPRYDKVRKSSSFVEAAHAVQEAGYATDSRYPSKLIAIYNDPKFPKYGKIKLL